MPFLKNVLKLSILPIESVFIIEFDVKLKVKNPVRSFSLYNSKTNAVRKILISDLESASKNASIKRKKGFIFGYVHKVKFYQYFFLPIFDT